MHHRDGRWAHHDARAHHDAPLQCGHAFVGVETEGYSEERANWLMLQWGHAFVSVETGEDEASLAAGRSFNGATLL